MANPSLQIGNSNWAIKEDNLLGYSTAGTRFVPQPITMTRASAGTRVNSSGLVETVELLGSEEVTNGDFATDSDWSKATGVTISGGNAIFNNSTANNNGIYQGTVFQANTQYKITAEVSNYSSGNVTAWSGGSQNSASNESFTGNGIKTWIISTGASNGYFILSSATTNGNFNIDNISVKEVTKNNLARVDYDGTASSLLVEPERTNVFIQNDISTWNGFSSYAGNTTAPDGTIINFVNMEDRRIFPTTTIINSTEYTSSIYLKGNKTADVKLRNTAANDTVITLSTEWQRFELTATSVSTVTNTLLIDARFSQGMGVSGLEVAVYGGQTEVGSYPTSYIPTDGSTVTRVKDQYSKTGISNLINSEEGVLFAEMSVLANDGTFKGISLSDGSASNKVRFYTNPTENQLSIRVTVGGVHQLNVVYTLTDLKTYNKVALKYKANDFAFWVNGVEVKADLSGTTFASNTLNKLALSNGSGSDYFFGKVKQLQVFKTALTDPELAALTS
jgi:hypothetical protein